MRFYLAMLQIIAIICLILFARWAYVDVVRSLAIKAQMESASVSPVEGSSESADAPPSR